MKYQHQHIERSESRMWKLSYLKEVMAGCKEAEFDVEYDVSDGTIVIGLEDTDQIFLKALKTSGSLWMVRYDRKLFDETAT